MSLASNDATSPITPACCRYTSLASLEFSAPFEADTSSSTLLNAAESSSDIDSICPSSCQLRIVDMATSRFKGSDFRSCARRHKTERASSTRNSSSTSSLPAERICSSKATALRCWASLGSKNPTMTFASRTTSAFVVERIAIGDCVSATDGRDSTSFPKLVPGYRLEPTATASGGDDQLSVASIQLGERLDQGAELGRQLGSVCGFSVFHDREPSTIAIQVEKVARHREHSSYGFGKAKKALRLSLRRARVLSRLENESQRNAPDGPSECWKKAAHRSEQLRLH